MNETKWATRAAVEIEGDHVHITLSCGHCYDASPHWNAVSIQDYYTIMARLIGRNQRCPDCENDVSPGTPGSIDK